MVVYKRAWGWALICSTVITACTFRESRAADFYSGKQIRIIVGSDPGGGYDAYARLLASNINRFIPGDPTIIVQNMAGADAMIATNYVANVAPKDGTVIGAINPGVVSSPLFHPEQVKFDPREFNWLGSVLQETQTISVWHTAPVQSFQELFSKELIVGGTSGTTTIFPILLNAVLGTKFKVVDGYSGTGAALLAVENGELQGMGGDTWASLKATHGDLLRDGKLKVIAHYGLGPHPELHGIPAVLDFAKTAEQKEALTLVLSRQALGRPYMMAGGVPADRIKILRDAFNATMLDKAFRDDAAKRKLDLDPIDGEKLAQLVDETYATPSAVIEKVKAILGDKI
jgi:tripartite-type tricarboxylate transporter receptor subunit TctC